MTPSPTAEAEQGAGGFQQVDISDMFGEMFGFGDLFGNAGGRGGRRSRAQRGNDIREDLSIAFEDAAFGVEKQVTIRRHELCDSCRGTGAAEGKAPSQCKQCNGHGQVRYQQGFFSVARTCPVCQGTGTMIEHPCAKCKGQRLVSRTHTLQVKVPPGVENGTRILYSGHGDAGLDGGPAGDVYVVLHVAEHAFFEREGKDLHCAIPISFTQAALGATVKIPTLDGEATAGDSRGHAVGNALPGAQEGRAGAQRQRARRSVCRSEGDHAGEADAAAARIAGAAGRDAGAGEQSAEAAGCSNKMKDIFS